MQITDLVVIKNELLPTTGSRPENRTLDDQNLRIQVFNMQKIMLHTSEGFIVQVLEWIFSNFEYFQRDHVFKTSVRNCAKAVIG